MKFNIVAIKISDSQDNLNDHLRSLLLESTTKERIHCNIKFYSLPKYIDEYNDIQPAQIIFDNVIALYDKIQFENYEGTALVIYFSNESSIILSTYMA